MSHPIYSRQALELKKIYELKKIAAEIGVPTPEGKKNYLKTWVDAIINHQSRFSKIESLELLEPQAVIEHDEDSFEGLTQPYVLKVDQEEVFRASTYMACERHCNWKGYYLVSTQEIAQQELERFIGGDDERGSGRIYDQSTLQKHLSQDLDLTADFVMEIEKPREPAKRRRYFIDRMVLVEVSENKVSKSFEIWIDGKFEYFLLAHTAFSSICFMFWTDHYSSIGNLKKAVFSRYYNRDEKVLVGV